MKTRTSFTSGTALSLLAILDLAESRGNHAAVSGQRRAAQGREGGVHRQAFWVSASPFHVGQDARNLRRKSIRRAG
jgi:hypothetical protein